jgi:hypothetical protein
MTIAAAHIVTMDTMYIGKRGSDRMVVGFTTTYAIVSYRVTSKVFLLTHFPGPLACRISQVPLYSYELNS